jgi:subtilisin family serine protease
LLFGRRNALKKVVSIVLFFTIVFAFLPVYANQSTPNKVSQTLISDVGMSKNLIPVMVELISDPVTVYSLQSFTSNHYYSSESFEYGSNGEEVYRDQLIEKQELFLQNLRDTNISFSFKHRCTDVMNSLALDVKGSDIKKLSTLPQIHYVHDDRMVFYTTRTLAAESTGAKKAWAGTGSLGSITGKGVIVGVLDTGLDKVHMTDGEFKGRVLGGFDTADGDPDFDDPAGHGTHVAGIVGGKGKLDSQKGMAYEVKFQIYKVFSNKGGGAGGTAISQAIDRSVRDKCAVINMSLGSESDTTSSAKNSYYGTLIRNANKGGTIVVASAGNAGSRGKLQPFPAGSPGITEEAFCVAATNDRPTNTFTVSTDTVSRNIRLTDGSGSPSFTSSLNDLPIISCGYGNPEDFEEDVSGKIALIQRGPKGNDKMTFRYKMDNAIAKGAVAVLLYNHTANETISPSLSKDGDTGDEKFIPTAIMSLEDGLWLLSILQEEYKVSFTSVSQHSVAVFSSMGPTPDGFFKPEITAPGTRIVSTVPEGQYSPMDGTSMSSPAVTGLVALLKQAYPKWNSDQVKSAFMNTAEILINPINHIPTTFLLQGAGLARIDRALVTPALISPRALIIQKEKIEPGKLKPEEAVKFTLESNSPVSQTFPLSFQIFGFPEDIGLIKVNFAQEQIVVPPSKKVDFTALFEIEWKQLTKNSYEGIIQVGEDLHIPFVIFRDSVLKVPDAISNVVIGPKEMTFSSDSTEQDIKINFSLNSGSEKKGTVFDNGVDYNNYASVELFVTDEQGEMWGTIANLNNYAVGDYEYHWNGKSTDGKFFLPKGKFFIQFQIMGVNIDTRESYLYFSTKQDETSKIDIAQSTIPDPSPLFLTGNKIIQMNDVFPVSLVIPQVTNCIGIEFELTYDSKKLIGKEVLDGGFLSSDGTSVSIDEYIDDNKGIIRVKILRDEPGGISGKQAKIVTLIFKAIYTGKLKFTFKTTKILFADDSTGRMKALYPDIRISKLSDFLLADINEDKTVDQYDWILFSESFQSKLGDINFSSTCDFNQDQVVDFEDFMILTKEYGKVL